MALNLPPEKLFTSVVRYLTFFVLPFPPSLPLPPSLDAVCTVLVTR